jgi:GT2 family glycosyltransferase
MAPLYSVQSTTGEKMRGKLGIGLPQFNGFVDLDFLDCWTILQKPDFTYYRPPKHMKLSDIDKVRNYLAKEALNDGCDFLLMLDTDQIFKPDTAIKLLNDMYNLLEVNPKIGAVGAKIFKRYPPFEPIMSFVDKEYLEETGETRYYLASKEQQHDKGLLEVDATGTGCILYNCRVFKEIEYPWFKFEDRGTGEDIGFCEKMRKADFNIYVDRDVEVPQMAKLIVNQALHDVFMLIEKIRRKEDD